MRDTRLRWNAFMFAAAQILLYGMIGPVVLYGQNRMEQTVDGLKLQQISSEISIDGILDEAAWDAIEPLPLTTYEPVFGDPMTERTEIRVGYDERFLYVSGKLYDSDPAAIRANSMYRDLYSGDDTFAIILDTFNDQENALWFVTTPNGVRLDMAISNDLEGGGSNPFDRVINRSWNTFWDAASSRTEEGWFAEMRIPFSSLGFQDNNGTVLMGLGAHRYISRKNERHVFPSTPPNWDMAYAKPSQFQKVVLENARSQRPVYITPYVAGGLLQDSQLNDAETAYLQENDFTRDVGVDLKYNVTSNLTLDVTVNTDFAQVEADDEQVNLTRFSLFFPEKRQFFQERASVFEFRTHGRFDRLFHTRQIGLSEGEQIPIIAGARLVGRLGGWDMGVINMQTARHTALPSENFGVYRLRRRILNTNSYVGALLTTRLDEEGQSNVAYGLDGIFRFGSRDYLDIKWAQTFSDTVPDNQSLSENGFARMRLERQGTIGLSYIASLIWSSANFNPGIGFVSRTDFVQLFNRLSYGWFANEGSPIQSFRPGLLSSMHFRNEDGTLETGWFRHDWELRMKSGDMHTVEIEARFEDLLEPISFPEDTDVPAGQYDYYAMNWQYQMRDGSLFRTNAETSIGTFFDGWNIQIQTEPTWNLSSNLELGAIYQFNRVRFPDRDQAFYVHLAQLKMQVGFSTRMSISSFLQYNTANDALSANLRFRYNFREGNDLWLVFNEGRNTDRFGTRPVLPVLDTRTILLKYTYTFIR